MVFACSPLNATDCRRLSCPGRGPGPPDGMRPVWTARGVPVMLFADRAEAGRLLAEKLTAYADHPDVLVLALPRGGVPVAAEVARRLHAPLDVFLVRKLGVPGHEELAMGAIATGGVLMLNDSVVALARVTGDEIQAAVAREEAELRRRERAYRGGAPAPRLHDRTAILVDDGLATAAPMRAPAAAPCQHPATATCR